MWNLRKKKNKLIKNRLTNIVDDLVMNRGDVELGGWKNGMKG